VDLRDQKKNVKQGAAAVIGAPFVRAVKDRTGKSSSGKSLGGIRRTKRDNYSNHGFEGQFTRKGVENG